MRSASEGVPEPQNVPLQRRAEHARVFAVELRRAFIPTLNAADSTRLVASLLTEDNRWINGQRIEASGGMSL